MELCVKAKWLDSLDHIYGFNFGVAVFRITERFQPNRIFLDRPPVSFAAHMEPTTSSWETLTLGVRSIISHGFFKYH